MSLKYCCLTMMIVYKWWTHEPWLLGSVLFQFIYLCGRNSACKTQRATCRSWFSPLVGPGYWTEIIRLGHNLLYLMRFVLVLSVFSSIQKSCASSILEIYDHLWSIASLLTKCVNIVFSICSISISLKLLNWSLIVFIVKF